VKKISGSHSGEALAESIHQTISSFNIVEKIITITTDNGANIVKACDILNSDKYACLHFKRIPCFAHLLNSIVKSSLTNLGFGSKKVSTESNDNLEDEIEDAVDQNRASNSTTQNTEIIENSLFMSKCRKLVGLFSHSTLLHEQLISDQKQEYPNKEPLRLIQDVPTRWNSLYCMMDRIKTAGNSVNRVLLSENNRQDHSEKMITDPEFEKIMDLVEGLQAFYLATKTISAEKYVSRSLIVPLLNLIDNSLVIKDRDSVFLRKLKKDLKKSLDSYLEKYAISSKDPDLLTSTVLDPLSKTLSFIDSKK